MNFLYFLLYGMINMPWWGYLIIVISLTQLTLLANTIFLHRNQAHHAIDLNPFISHIFRFWIWLTTGMVTKEWVAIHRKHHAFTDNNGDPHSPVVFGIDKVLFKGAELYQEEAKNSTTINRYGNATPDDWVERNLYAKYDKLGVSLMLVINIVLFGAIGLSIWAVQMLCIPICAAGIINGIGHWGGYRNFEVSDNSRNIVPWGILITGEELHNNHHACVSSAKFSSKWYEFDLGWIFIKCLAWLRLAKINKVAPKIHIANTPKASPDLSILKLILANKYNLAVEFAKTLKHDCTKEIARLNAEKEMKVSWLSIKKLIIKDPELLSKEELGILSGITQQSRFLNLIFSMRFDLSRLWAKSSLTKVQLVKNLQIWCQKAESSGVAGLDLFSKNLRALTA